MRADVRFAPRAGVRAYRTLCGHAFRTFSHVCGRAIFFAHIKQIHMKTNTQIAITTATTTHKKKTNIEIHNAHIP